MQLSGILWIGRVGAVMIGRVGVVMIVGLRGNGNGRGRGRIGGGEWRAMERLECLAFFSGWRQVLG